MTNSSAASDDSTRALFGPIVAVVLGVSLWVQLASFTLQGTVEVTQTARLLAIVLPFIALFGGVATRSPVALLGLFPLTLVPPLMLSPDGAATSFADPWSAGRVCASIALYLAVCGAWLRDAPEHVLPPDEDVDESDTRIPPSSAHIRYTRDVRRHVMPRVLPLMLWWAVPTYAIFWDPAIVGTIEQSFGDSAAVAQIFISCLLFFAWAVVAYLWFLVPSLNLEYDRRRWIRDAEIATAEPARAIVRRIGITTIGTLAVVGLLVMVV